MYYCNNCAEKSNLNISYFKTYRDCDICGEYRVVSDNCQNYALPAEAPVFRTKNPTRSKNAHGIFRVEIA